MRDFTDERASATTIEFGNDILCMSHLRWSFVFQRPQHVMTRLARDHRVFFVEEPRWADEPAHLEVTQLDCGVRVVVPVLPPPAEPDVNPDVVVAANIRALLDRLIDEEDIRDFVLWTSTPMALPATRHLRPLIVVYDCMDDLGGFAGAPPGLRELDMRLMAVADVVTTGGLSLYEARRDQNPNVHPVPSSIDAPHFIRARHAQPDPADQRDIDHPRIGFAGVIDERMDLDLVAGVADARPDWQLVLLGPIVKIDPAAVPRRPNVHQLGIKNYDELPAYMAGWQVGMLPFARNAATRFISPTKTPEYLAAGLPVVSTSIRDVVRPYADVGLARIGDSVPEFIAAIEAALADDRARRWDAADRLLSQSSWDQTVANVRALMQRAIERARAAVGVSVGLAAEAV